MAILDFYHDAATIRQRVDSGVWANQTLDDYLQQHVRQRGDIQVAEQRDARGDRRAPGEGGCDEARDPRVAVLEPRHDRRADPLR